MPHSLSLAPPMRRRRQIGVTSMIDVIFLLLLFFMLSSTFDHYGEVDLVSATGGGTASADTPPLFAQLGPDSLTVNGRSVAFDAIPTVVAELGGAETVMIVALQDEVDAQRLVDLLAVLHSIQGLSVSVLE